MSEENTKAGEVGGDAVSPVAAAVNAQSGASVENTATVGAETAVAETVGEGPRIKVRKSKQRACDEKDGKGKLCAGHLKRWYEVTPEVEKVVGKGAEVYRCEFCKVVYRPDPEQWPNSYTVRY